jgi:hypothetical protein
MPILGVDRERLVRVLQNLLENAVRPSVQQPPSESGTTSMKDTTDTTPSSGASSSVPPLADAAPRDVEDASPALGTRSKAGARARPGSGPERNTADEVSSADIDQLRDVIFGGQIREYERRFARMEERLAKELADVREEVRDRCTALERYVRDEVESITVEVRANQQSATADAQRLSQFVVDSAKAAEDRITTLSDLVPKQHRELRAQLLEQTKTITNDVQRRHAHVQALVARDAAELRDGKADRAALSALFMEVALRLRGDSVVPAESVEPQTGVKAPTGKPADG